MKTLIVNQWGKNSSIRKLIHQIRSEELTDIVYFGYNEYEIEENSPADLAEFERLLHTRNIKFHYVIGAFHDYKFYKNSVRIPKVNTTIYSHEYYWIYDTYYNTRKQSPEMFEKYVDNGFTPLKVDKLFISLNNNAHHHRVYLMDELSKEGLLPLGNVSWLNRGGWTDLPFKHWKEERLVLDQSFADHFNSYVHTPEQYFTSAINVISESTEDVVFLTEKTFLAILMGKPFIIQGPQGIHQALKMIGIKLYEDVFDYSFDNYSDIHDRTAAVVQNIKKIADRDPQDLYNDCAEIARYNQKRLLEIIENKEYIPPAVKYFESLPDEDVIRP